MSFLLDTHVLLWLLAAPERVVAEVRGALADRRNHLFVSAASAMEVATKVRLGKLVDARALVTAWSNRIEEIGAKELPLSASHALLAGSMEWENRDPFDRQLVAQALSENLVLVTVDRLIIAMPGLRVLTWS